MSKVVLLNLLQSIKNNLKEGRYRNEATIREALVLPILQQLGWDTNDPSTVRREYPILSRRADYCLFGHAETSDILIEVKAVGSIEGGDEQLFRYAYTAGVPMAILTYGCEWSFYLPSGYGSYDDRRVYRLDLLERSGEDACRIFDRYLDFERVKKKGGDSRREV